MSSSASRRVLLLLAALAASALGGCRGNEAKAAPEAGRTSAPAPAQGRDGTGVPTPAPKPPMADPASPSPTPDDALETATLGAGCFWCIEAVLERIPGIRDVTSGFMGGTLANPTYRDVCTGETGHAEVAQIRFDPKVLSYAQLLDWFWKLHDPTTKDRQNNDEGTQYRSVIFYHSDAQRRTAEASLAAAQKGFSRPIVTEITAASAFYKAEDYHQDFFRRNQDYPYCRVWITPKLHKLGLDGAK